MKKRFIVLHIIIPLFAGGILYYVSSPDVIFVRLIDNVSGIHLHTIDPLHRLIRNYGLDILWAYALMFALFYVTDNNMKILHQLFGVAVLFVVIMEAIQILPSVKGTFDVLDIVVEILAMAAAVLIIKKHGGSK